MSSTASSPTAAAPGSPPGPVRSRVWHRGSLGMLVGGLIMVVGSVLPWVSTPLGSLPGTAGPGLWTLCAGFVAIAGALIPIRWVAIAHALLSGVAVTGIVVWQLARLIEISASTDSWGQLLPGMGLVMAAGGAVVLLRTGRRLVGSTAADGPPGRAA